MLRDRGYFLLEAISHFKANGVETISRYKHKTSGSHFGGGDGVLRVRRRRERDPEGHVTAKRRGGVCGSGRETGAREA